MIKLAILIVVMPVLAFGQGYPMTGAERAQYYKSRGLSLDPPPVQGTPYPIAQIPKDSAAFKSLFAQVLLAYPDLTQENFLTTVENGMTYDITKTGPVSTCKKCNGFGRIPDKKSKNADKKSECLECKGVGKVEIRTHFKICWK